MNENKENFIIPYLKGVGQIMLQDNPWTGLLFLIGIFYDSFIIGLAAVLAVVTGTLTASVLKFPNANIKKGLYGFSATLTGVAMVTFFNPVPVVWIAIIIGSALAAVLQHLFISKNIPGFTFPFILVTWILYYIFSHVYQVGAQPAIVVINDSNLAGLALRSRGFGEVIFQTSIIAGVLFFVGVYLSSPVAALYGLAGGSVSATVAYFFHENFNDIIQGMFSFNAVLCAITFAGIRQKDGPIVLISVILAVIIEIVMIRLALTPYLTFPFVGACWIVLAFKKLLPG